MSARSQRSERRPDGGGDREGSSGDSHANHQSTAGSTSRQGRTDFRPPRSRTPTSSRHAADAAIPSPPSGAHHPGRDINVQWQQRPDSYRGESERMPEIFSPPRSAQSTPRATNNVPGTMEDNSNQPVSRNDTFTVDLESDEFPPDVFSLPVGSFNEDSPPRGHSSDSDERHRRRSSPRASPIVRNPPMPIYHDSAQRERLYPSTYPPAQSPSPEARRAAAETQYAYYPEPADWYSPPPIEHSGTQYGGTPQRSPIRLQTPSREGSHEHFQRTPSRPAPFPFEVSPPRDAYDLINTPKAPSAEDMSLVEYDDARLGIPDQHMIYGDSDRKPPASSGAPPLQSPLSGFLQDFAPSPTIGDISSLARSPPSSSSNRRATGPYGRHPYPPMPPYQHRPHPHTLPPSTLKASPVVSQESRPRKLWNQESQRQGHSAGTPAAGSGMRVELGSRKGLEGINQMMRAQTSTPTAHRMSSHHRHPHYPYHPHYHHMRGPPRMPSHYPFSASRRTPPKAATPTPRGVSGYPFGTAESKPAPPVTKPTAHPLPAQGTAASKQPGMPKDKENETQPKVTPQKRNPCNCKKSRCLKLYCECFSAELFCDGCNCTDCYNNDNHKDLRDKAMKETKAKNPKAFQPRLNLVSDNPAESNHSMGCRCKKSECLKKYCECFQAGVFCAGKCKCKGCSNFAGSQKLIDKRRKMKDIRGAEIAMRAAADVWKGQSSGRKPGPSPSKSTPIASRTPLVGGIVRQSPDTRPSTSQTASRGHYIGQSFIHRPPNMNFSPLGIQPVTPGYPSRTSGQLAPRTSVVRPSSLSAPTTAPGTKRPVSNITPSTAPRTPAVRLEFDPSSSRKRRKKGNQDEETFPYFGPDVPHQPKTTALAVFSFLSNEDVYKAALVSKVWKSLAEDGELWQFP